MKQRLSAVEQHDRNAVLMYRRACQAGSVPAPDSPLAKAAARAVRRQEELHPGFDFIKGVLGTEAPIEAKQPIPANNAWELTRASLAGVGTVDLSGGASTIQTDIQRWKDAERGRQVLNDPLFSEALEQASIRAAKEGRKATARDFNTALAEARAKSGPTPYVPPPPVTPLLAPTAAKSTASGVRYSVVPDRFGGK